jgi:hypothetical protein
MSYTYISIEGSTPAERLKNSEGFITNSVKQTKEEANAFLMELKASGKPIIISRVEEDDVYTYCLNSEGDKELTASQIADLKSRYDFSNMTPDAYKALLAELNMMGVLRYGQSQVIADIGNGGTITPDDIQSYLQGQIAYAEEFLGWLRASSTPSCLRLTISKNLSLPLKK